MSEQNQTTFQCVSSFIFLTHPTVLLKIQKITQAQISEIRIETLDGETIWQKNNGHIIDKINFQKLVVIMTNPIDVRKFSATINESNFKHSITKITGLGAGSSGSPIDDNQYTGPRKSEITVPRDVKLRQLYKATEKEVKDMGLTALNKPGTSEKVEATGPDGKKVVAAAVALPVEKKGDPRKFAFMAVRRENAGIINEKLDNVFDNYKQLNNLKQMIRKLSREQEETTDKDRKDKINKELNVYRRELQNLQVESYRITK